MNHFDMDMVAIVGLIFLMGVLVFTFLKEMLMPLIGLFLVVVMVWGDDICSRNDRVSFYGDHFDRGGEIICKEDNANPLLLSQSQGWEHKGEYLFKGSRGIDLLNDHCEIIGKSEPHCIPLSVQIIIGVFSLVALFGWMAWMFARMDKRRHQKDESNKDLHTHPKSVEQIDEDDHDTQR
ncbi:MAG: hypothetical protein PHW18_09610 [Sulfuricurvum sp.]|uniref:hypothetical protein n=1 Tax=Sulfuricurvum sp. TaxID=2025608 RepID=UPI002608E8D0|nr:hypothetical protein [Sulfuricurvum sp.]MDD2829815.1 hypothetical protein [Sulfuricurvum sp.]MDD4950276.1 hypothetical protein [Sulfuricurvum sp.]